MRCLVTSGVSSFLINLTKWGAATSTHRRRRAERMAWSSISANERAKCSVSTRTLRVTVSEEAEPDGSPSRAAVATHLDSSCETALTTCQDRSFPRTSNSLALAESQTRIHTVFMGGPSQTQFTCQWGRPASRAILSPAAPWTRPRGGNLQMGVGDCHDRVCGPRPSLRRPSSRWQQAASCPRDARSWSVPSKTSH